MKKYHPLFHKFKLIIGYSIAVIVILLALGVSGLRFILTTANLYQTEVEELASSLLEQPVKIGNMDAKLSGLMPTLIFHNVKLLSEKTQKPLFELFRIDVGISFESLLFQQKVIPTQLTIRGMDLQITRKVDGSFKIKGVDLKGLTTTAAEENKTNAILNRLLLQKSEIGVEDSTIIWKDEQNAGLTWFFDKVNFLLKNGNGRHQLSLSSNLPSILGKKIKLDFDLVGDLSKPESWDIKTFIESKDFNVNPIQKYIKNKKFKINNGIVDLKLWADWKNENIKRLSGDIQLNDFSYQVNRKKRVNLDNVSAMFDAQHDDTNMWNVSVEKFNYTSYKKTWPEINFSLIFNDDDIARTFYVKADYLRLAELTQIINDNDLIDLESQKKLNNLNIQGDLKDFYIAWQKDGVHQLNAKFNKLGINSWKKIPNLKGLSGNIDVNQRQGKLTLRTNNALVGFPLLFRKPFNLNKLNADIDFLNTEKGFLFNVNHLVTENAEVTASSRAKLWYPKDKSSPYLDLQTYVTKGDASKVSHYLPVGIMKKSLVNWLDEGILDGDVDKGAVIFQGKINDFPFKNNEGVFITDVDVSNFVLNYQNGWPKIEKAKINAEFTGQGMELHLTNGKAKNNLLYDSFAKIPTFSSAELRLNINASGSVHNAMQYMVNSPILPQAKKPLKSMRLGGEILTRFIINIPLDEKIRKKKSLTYVGNGELKDTSLFMLDDRVDITDVSGKIAFTEKGIKGKDILAKINGEKATLSVKSLAKNKGIKIYAKGKINPSLILKRFKIPGANKISGVTSFYGDILFPGNRAIKKYPILTINSNLVGVKSTLPETFYKNERTQQKFISRTIFTGGNRTQLGFEFGDKLSAILELDQSGDVTYLNRGSISASNKNAILPKKNILYIDGSIKRVTPSKWVEGLNLGQDKKPQTFFVNPIVLNLDELNIFTVQEKSGKDGKTLTHPQDLPLFEGIIKKLTFDKTFLGRMDFKTSSIKYGLHLDEMILSARNMKLFVNGDWQFKRGKHKTEMDLTLSSNNFGEMLTDLDFSAIIDKGKAMADGQIKWKGAPTEFTLNKLNGNLQLNIKNGNIREVDAGSGRLLGLFSLSALPRKLFGDFKDTFKSGFSFDQARGNIKIIDGDAYTDNFEIKSPVAEIMVRGRTGLATRDYENVVEVVPDVGGGIAGVTALLVNLPAGIGLWLIDKLTGEQIDEASSRIYEINGSWDAPEIQLIEDQ